MSAVWALVPAKSFGRAKSRLAERLGDTERAELARAMLDHVLATLFAAKGFAGVAVVTDGDDVARVARARGARVLRDGSGPPLAGILDAALAAVRGPEVEAALVIMSDLPEIAVADVEELREELEKVDVLAAPDLRDEGTNALGLRPPDCLVTAFGVRDSFARHVRAAQAARLSVGIHRSYGVGFDVDEPADLDRLRRGASR
jgi:2-phospho-L-lactate guanylyltransferase